MEELKFIKEERMNLQLDYFLEGLEAKLEDILKDLENYLKG